MSRVNATVPSGATRIEDEVWQDAFVPRGPAKDGQRLRAIEGGAPRPVAEPTAGLPTAGVPTAGVPTAGVATPDLPIAPAPPSPRDPIRAHDTGAATRRTIHIQGRGAERNLPLPDASRRRTQRRAYERNGFRPDRVAMWAVLLGFLLVFVAIASGHS